MNSPYLTDAEIDEMCDGLEINAAKVRHLQSFGLTVNRKPNGRPLVLRSHSDAVLSGQAEAIAKAEAPPPQLNTAGIIELFSRRKVA
ncbi:hypothetical protein [Ottowia thiooxydans]|uniref:NADH:ubiquinone oxidoreductase subunit E n=1 Tax=Ottowia thiooxydans TaxID=219182 RepID=A0ABV2Q1T4_9BURK